MPAAKRGNRPDKRPARSNYWKRRSLEKNKVRHLVKSNGMDTAEAMTFWRSARKRFGA